MQVGFSDTLPDLEKALLENACNLLIYYLVYAIMV
jgi:hypothetical protein